MSHDLKTFGQLLAQRFRGATFELKQIIALNEALAPLHLFVFRNYPDKGLMTLVTYGLSEANHPKWHFGKPELILSVESKQEEWAKGLASVVKDFRGKKAFSNGSVYLLDQALCYESGMSGFVMYVPSFLKQEESIFQMPGNKTLYLVQAYPIYPGEAEMIVNKGFESFWTNKKFQDPYDVKREDVSPF